MILRAIGSTSQQIDASFREKHCKRTQHSVAQALLTLHSCVLQAVTTGTVVRVHHNSDVLFQDERVSAGCITPVHELVVWNKLITQQEDTSRSFTSSPVCHCQHSENVAGLVDTLRRRTAHFLCGKKTQHEITQLAFIKHSRGKNVPRCP